MVKTRVGTFHLQCEELTRWNSKEMALCTWNTKEVVLRASWGFDGDTVDARRIRRHSAVPVRGEDGGLSE